MARQQYFISFNNVSYTEFYPSNEPVLKLEQEPGEIFKRWKVDRFRITKTKNSVYCTLLSMFFDPLSFGVSIYYRIDINGVPKFRFVDKIRAGNINIQNEVYECTPDPDDSYQPILDLYQKKWNNTSGSLFGLFESLYFPVKHTGNFANVDFYSFTPGAGTLAYVNDGSPAGPNFARNTIPVPSDNGLVTILVTGLSYTGDAPRLKLVDQTYTACSNEVTVSANGKYELTMSGLKTAVYVQLSQNNLTGSSKSGSFDYVCYLPTHTLSGATLYNLLDRILNFSAYFALSPVCSVVSTILWNDPLGSDPPASIDTYMTANPSNDYVLEDTAVFNNLYLCRTDAFTTDEADNVELSFKDIMDILKSKRLFWFIDEDGLFRIEHEKYFRSYDPQADLTDSSFAKYQPEIDHHIYSYEGESYNQLTYKEENALNEDWGPDCKIEFSVDLTGPDVKDVRTAVTTDLKNVLENPDSASNTGLTLLRCDGFNNILFDQSLVTPANYYPNQKLSPAWINDYYSQYFAEARDGETVTGPHTFTHVKESVKQSGVRFKMSSDLDWKKPFTLFVGTGWIGNCEYFPETGMYSIDFVYDPYATTIVVPGTGSGSHTVDSTTITVDDTSITVDG
jgi:hypothetical protein